MRQNVTKYYTFQFFYALSFAFVPFFVLFMRDRGLSFTEIGLATSIYYFCFLIFELPTGVIADKLGRKNTIIVTTILKFIGVVTCLFSYSIYSFIIAEIILSMARAMGSGATNAFLYDSLLYIKEEHQYKRVVGKAYSVHLSGNALSGVLGALMLIFFELEYIYIFAAAAAFLAMMVAISFKESLPKLQYKDALNNSIKSYHGHLIASIRDVLKNKKIIWFILYASLLFLLIRATLISLQQPLLIYLKLPKYYFGLVDTVMSLGAVFFSYYAYWIEKRLGFLITFLIMPIILIISYLGMGLNTSMIVLIFMFIQLIVIGMYPPIIRDYLNKEIKDSNKRATILSVESLVSRLIFSVYSLFLGVVLDLYSVQMAMLVTAGVAVVGVVVLFVGREVVKIRIKN